MRVKEEITGEFSSASVELIKGSGGIFTVDVDGKIVYDKEKTGKFPEAMEVNKLLK